MRKMLLFLVLTMLAAMSAQAQDHLLITEFVVTPTSGEFVEIHNPTDAPVDLSNYYLTDATFAGGSTYYYNIVTGNGGGGGFNDFNARFPDGATIAAGEYQTIALAGDSLFFDIYNVLPTYELFEDSTDFANDAPEMRDATPGSIATPFNGSRSSGFSGSGEVAVLYFWDGASDLVMDVDYVVWGDKVEAVDKTGVSIDGPDADTDESVYANDTAISDQFVVNADNDGDGDPHDSGMSAQRLLGVEDLETWTNGNGITGHDETSENTSWKGGVWSINAPATPNASALPAYATSDSMNIAEANFVRADDIGIAINDDSPFVNDTLTISGIFMQGPREIFIGNRWGGFVMDKRGGPWSGFFVIQNDTTAGKEGTLLPAIEPGDEISVTGVMSEFPSGGASISQLALLTDPIVPIEILTPGQPLPQPVLLTPGDLGLTGSGDSADPQLAERWEGALARFEGLTVTANGLPGNTMTASDQTGTIVLDDYFNAINTAIAANANVWPGLPAGTVINVTGFVRGGTTSGLITINPRSLNDIEVASAPPDIQIVARNPVAPNSTQDVTVSATIVGSTSNVAGATVSYRVNGGAFQSVAMTNTAENNWDGLVPVQSDADFVEYIISATNANNETSTAPGDTAATKFFYTIRDGGLRIADVQFTPFSDGRSGYTGLEVTVTGVAITDSSDNTSYWLQEGVEPWSGVWVNDNVTNVKIGDEVTVTGTVEENRFSSSEVTRISNVTATINSSGNALPEPIILTTAQLASGSTEAEMYENMLVQVQNVKISTEFSDGGNNFGEFSIDDGSGELRVDDFMAAFRGQQDSLFVLGDDYFSITGIHLETFGNYKLAPRNNDDVRKFPVSVEVDGNVPYVFALEQNYPNPFNPKTQINFEIAQEVDVKIQIFNVLGQRVRTLVNRKMVPGKGHATWFGKNDFGAQVSTGIYIYRIEAGDFVKSQKMLFLK